MLCFIFIPGITPPAAHWKVKTFVIASRSSSVSTPLSWVYPGIAWHHIRAAQKFPFDLVSDADEKLCKKFDVIKEKNMYGKIVMGIERSTFILDDKGVLRAEFRKVKVPGHVEAVLEEIKKLKK
jgi:alkyl hydroperoxide reductase subunit AhpC